MVSHPFDPTSVVVERDADLLCLLLPARQQQQNQDAFQTRIDALTHNAAPMNASLATAPTLSAPVSHQNGRSPGGQRNGGGRQQQQQMMMGGGMPAGMMGGMVGGVGGDGHDGSGYGDAGDDGESASPSYLGVEKLVFGRGEWSIPE
jgi:hypothetical protein